MTVDEFKPGRISWTTGLKSSLEIKSDFLQNDWHDGFAAFANLEQRLNPPEKEKFANFLNGRTDNHGGPEGYLMEAGLWRHTGTKYEELSLERAGTNFFVQYWQLRTANIELKLQNCFFRESKTFVRGNIEIFSGSLPSFEVVMPMKRLRFYIIKGA